MKQKRDALATKAKILENSRILFSKKGFDATTVDDIAKVSDVNKALIYYYFKNKSGLYTEIMSSLFDAIYKEVNSSSKQSKQPKETLKAFIYTYASYAQKYPYFPALLLRELSDSGAHLPEMMFASMRQLFVLLSEILQEGYEKKVFIKSMPMVVHFMIIGSINLLVTTQPLRKKATEFDSNINTCSECSMDDIATYIFENIYKMLEV